MARQRIWLVALVALALAVSGSTLADAKARHRFTATTQTATVSSTGTPPAAGSTATSAGTVRSSIASGAVVNRNTFSGVTGPGTFGFTSKSTVFGPHGSVSAKVKGTATLQANGSVKYAGSGTFTGGTDLYKGATGKFTFTGTSASPASVVTANFRGSITY